MSGQAVSAGQTPGSRPRRRWLKRLGIAVGVILVGLAAFALATIGPRNLIGMMRYDQRREGDLRVGSPAPETDLVALDGVTPVRLHDHIGGKPLVVVFGSFT